MNSHDPSRLSAVKASASLAPVAGPGGELSGFLCLARDGALAGRCPGRLARSFAWPLDVLEPSAELFQPGLQPVDTIAEDAGALAFRPLEESAEGDRRLMGGYPALPEPVVKGGIRLAHHAFDAIRPLSAHASETYR